MTLLTATQPLLPPAAIALATTVAALALGGRHASHWWLRRKGPRL